MPDARLKYQPKTSELPPRPLEALRDLPIDLVYPWICRCVMRKRGFASSRQAYGIPGSKNLIQQREKDYFIKSRGLGNIRKWRFGTPQDIRGLLHDSHW